jgi:hypothetical protein
MPVSPWLDPPAPEAFHGLAGEIVRAIEPESEADPVALLIQLLAAFGSNLGRTSHWTAEGVRHYLNLFAVLVGETGKARKGTSWGRIRSLFEEVDQGWVENRVVSGLSSGEGLIYHVRDRTLAREKVRTKGKESRVTRTQEYEADPGEADKRLLVQEAEFAGVLKQIERQGNSLSPILRQAWESGDLRTLVSGRVHAPVRATGAHVTVIGHITAEELRRYLTNTEVASGFGNRFLWLCVRRSKFLPEGGARLDLRAFADRLVKARAFATEVGELRRDDAARRVWAEVYPSLSEGRPGLAGAMTARAEAQTMRLACLYAVLDLSPAIRPEHLNAALALWDYCERSMRLVWGDSLGDPIADEILEGLRHNPEGLTLTAIRELLGRHVGADRTGRALGLLLRFGLANCREEAHTGGRPAQRWFARARPAP